MRLPRHLSSNYRTALRADLNVSILGFLDPLDPFQSCTSSQLIPDVLSNLFELSYGFREISGRRTRAAASAGARYPTELLLVRRVHHGYIQYLYDFDGRRFFRVSVLTEASLNLVLSDRGKGSDVWYVVALCMAWRTVSRYSTRGFQYGVIDAYNVIGNLSEVAHDVGGRSTILPCDAAARLGAAARFEGHLLPLGIIEVALDPTIAEQNSPVTVGPPKAGLSDLVPRFSPEMARVKELHRTNLELVRLRFSDVSFPSRKTRVRKDWALERSSLRECSLPLDFGTLTAILGSVADYLDLYSGLLDGHLSAYVDGGLANAVPWSELGAGRLRNLHHCEHLISRCFKEQQWLSNKNATVILFAISVKKRDKAIVRVIEGSIALSLMLGDLERADMGIGVKGSMLGGFSIESAQDLLRGNDVIPIIGYALGPAITSGKKHDADYHELVPMF